MLRVLSTYLTDTSNLPDEFAHKGSSSDYAKPAPDGNNYQPQQWQWVIFAKKFAVKTAHAFVFMPLHKQRAAFAAGALCVAEGGIGYK